MFSNYFVIFYFIISAFCANFISGAAFEPKTKAAVDHIKVLNYDNSIKEIVNDLISNWQSPIVYLKSRGYLPKEQKNGPEFTVEKLLKRMYDMEDGESKNEIKVKQQFRNMRSPEQSNKSNNLKEMFHKFFSTDDDTIASEIKTKLDVPWDMESIKQAAHRKAITYYNKFFNKNYKNVSEVTEIEEPVKEILAEQYPTEAKASIKQQLNASKLQNLQKISQLYQGLAKVLINRDDLSKPKQQKKLVKKEQQSAY